MATLIHNCYIALYGEPREGMLKFSFTPRDGITDRKSANWDNIDILGRQEPIRAYGNSSPREIGFSLDFYAEHNVYEDVKQRVDWLRSLVYPGTTTASATGLAHNISTAPKVILLYVGSLFQTSDGQPLHGIVKSVGITWKGPWGADAGAAYTADWSDATAGAGSEELVVLADMLPMYATVDLSIEEVDPKPAGGVILRRKLNNSYVSVAEAPPEGRVPRVPNPVGGLPSFLPGLEQIPPIGTVLKPVFLPQDVM